MLGSAALNQAGGNTLVVTKLGRLGRSLKDLKEIADELHERGIGLRALSQRIDTTTPGGRLFFHTLAAIAEFEHDLTVERTCGRTRPWSQRRPQVQAAVN